MKKYIGPFVVFLILCFLALPAIYFGIQRKEKQEKQWVADLCLAQGFEPNYFDAQTGKTFATARFCTDSKGKIYWPSKFKGLVALGD